MCFWFYYLTCCNLQKSQDTFALSTRSRYIISDATMNIIFSSSERKFTSKYCNIHKQIQIAAYGTSEALPSYRI